jgi:hypothetical protein
MQGASAFLRNAGVEIPAVLNPCIAKIGEAKTLREVLTASAIYTVLNAIVPEAHRVKYAPILKTLQRMGIAKLFIVSQLLRAATVTLAQNGIVGIELNAAVDARLGAAVAEAFAAANAFQATDFASYDTLLRATVIIATGIAEHMNVIADDAPLSLTLPGRDFSSILVLSEQALGFFRELQEGLEPLPELPEAFSRLGATSLLEDLWGHADAMKRQLAADPKTQPACISDIRLEALGFCPLLCLLPGMPDTKRLQQIVGGFKYDAPPEATMHNTNLLLHELGQLTSAIMQPTLEDAELAALDLRDPLALDALLRRMVDVQRKATVYDVGALLGKAEGDTRALELNLKKLIEFRLKNKFDLDLAKIAKFNALECFTHSLEIAAFLPLVAGNELQMVNELSLPLITRSSPEEVYAAVQRLLQLLTYSAPLREKTLVIANALYKKPDLTMPKEIAALAAENNITNLQKGENQRQGDVFNLCEFLGYAYATKYGEYNETAADDLLRQLLQKGSLARINGIVVKAYRACVMSATARGAFDPNLMLKVLKVLKALEAYQKTQSDSDFRNLCGAVSLLPTTFTPVGSMTTPWAKAVCLCDPTVLSEMVGASGELDTLIRSAFRHPKHGLWTDSDDEEEKAKELPPEIIYEDVIEEEEVGEPEIREVIERVLIEEEDEAELIQETEEVKMARAMECARGLVKSMKALKDAATSLEMPIVQARYEQFIVQANALYKCLPQAEAEALRKQVETVEQTIQRVQLGARSVASRLQEPLAWFQQMKKAMIGRAKTSPALSELALLSANIGALCRRVEHDPTKDVLRSGVPVRRQVAGDSIDILMKLRAIVKQIDTVLEKMKKIPYEKALQQSIAQVSESAQVFYLLARMLPYDDDALKAKAATACRRLLANVQGLMQQMPAGGGAQDITLRELSNETLGRLQQLLDFSTAAVVTTAKKVEKVDEAQVKAATTRLNAEAQVYKSRWVLELAKTEKERLDGLQQG